MQLKSPTDKPVHIALLSGQAMRIGPEGREVDPIFAQEAYSMGCIPANATVEQMTAAHAPPTELSQLDQLKTVLREMKADHVELTGAGLPNRNSVSAKVGWNVSAVQLTDAWNSLEE